MFPSWIFIINNLIVLAFPDYLVTVSLERLIHTSAF